MHFFKITALMLVVVLHHVSCAEQCNMAESVGKLVESCRAVQSCPSGWVKNKESGSCFKYFSDAARWDDARTKCKSYGGDLASLNTKQEVGFAWDLIHASIGSWTYVWIGLERSGSGWTWMDGTTLSIPTDAFWYPGEPNNARGDENGVHMYDSGLMNDQARGSNAYAFICEL